jgi:hypothetical protein
VTYFAGISLAPPDVRSSGMVRLFEGLTQDWRRLDGRINHFLPRMAQARPESNRPCDGSFVLGLHGAPLSSGFDIARKTLGQLEIATVQTATIDQIAGLANLTTFLRTRPGMIESDWPVCAITDTATPHQSDRYSYCGDHGVCRPLWGSQNGFEGVTH